ncbi:MAG TPA: PadR family transcriptional regulator [Candidatus Dormibacteraeota bacterium]|jgi:DNA-binding PadR family transcriptional regulator|nr:PadR family transcriptional regulator [Candidatus Dormibacteraeota bacterium]
MDRQRGGTWKGVAEVLRPRNLVQPGLLLLLEEAPGHGYDLQHRLEALLVWRVDSPTIYRVLNAMEEQGLVSSLWERSETGKERRRYVITDAGRGAGEAWMSELANASALLHGLLKRYECGGRAETAAPRISDTAAEEAFWSRRLLDAELRPAVAHAVGADAPRVSRT